MSKINKCITHGHTRGYKTSKEYNSWLSMKARCYNPNHEHFHFYGGRGIKICDRWLNSFENFLSDMGTAPSPTHSIDRIDNDGNYEQSNCRWLTHKEQCNNRRNNIYFTMDGITKTLAEWCTENGEIPYKKLWHRVNIANWPLKDALLNRKRKKQKTV